MITRELGSLSLRERRNIGPGIRHRDHGPTLDREARQGRAQSSALQALHLELSISGRSSINSVPEVTLICRFPLVEHLEAHLCRRCMRNCLQVTAEGERTTVAAIRGQLVDVTFGALASVGHAARVTPSPSSGFATVRPSHPGASRLLHAFVVASIRPLDIVTRGAPARVGKCAVVGQANGCLHAARIGFARVDPRACVLLCNLAISLANFSEFPWTSWFAIQGVSILAPELQQLLVPQKVIGRGVDRLGRSSHLLEKALDRNAAVGELGSNRLNFSKIAVLPALQLQGIRVLLPGGVHVMALQALVLHKVAEAWERGIDRAAACEQPHGRHTADGETAVGPANPDQRGAADTPDGHAATPYGQALIGWRAALGHCLCMLHRCAVDDPGRWAACHPLGCGHNGEVSVCEALDPARCVPWRTIERETLRIYCHCQFFAVPSSTMYICHADFWLVAAVDGYALARIRCQGVVPLCCARDIVFYVIVFVFLESVSWHATNFSSLVELQWLHHRFAEHRICHLTHGSVFFACNSLALLNASKLAISRATNTEVFPSIRFAIHTITVLTFVADVLTENQFLLGLSVCMCHKGSATTHHCLALTCGLQCRVSITCSAEGLLSMWGCIQSVTIVASVIYGKTAE
mmetsp:Transcript_76605/g.211600  ORF Transcript_76605/g.211600 Transcript_76605/m.211600 type:complete len:637 (+) Transcript_76605:3161-5071(+)